MRTCVPPRPGRGACFLPSKTRGKSLATVTESLPLRNIVLARGS